MSVTYTSVLPVREETVAFMSDLLAAERLRRGTRDQTRSLSCHDQAVLVLRWFLDGTRMSQLVRDNTISASTGYDYLHEGIDALAARAPTLHGALLAAKTAGHGHVVIDGIPPSPSSRPARRAVKSRCSRSGIDPAAGSCSVRLCRQGRGWQGTRPSDSWQMIADSAEMWLTSAGRRPIGARPP